mgnify:CR=1 FL=1
MTKRQGVFWSVLLGGLVADGRVHQLNALLLGNAGEDFVDLFAQFVVALFDARRNRDVVVRGDEPVFKLALAEVAEMPSGRSETYPSIMPDSSATRMAVKSSMAVC